MKTTEKELIVVEEPTKEVQPIQGSTLMKPAEFKKALSIQKQNREIIKEFVQSQLNDGTDFGTIKMKKKRADGSYYDVESKPVLFKPGQEKIFSLFQITDELTRDDETLSMFGNKAGLIAYKCTLYRQGIRIGEGRGAADINEKNGWTANNCIKIAEKRARMDACLSLGFSEYFTQDLDDTPPIDDTPAASKARDYSQPTSPVVPKEPIDNVADLNNVSTTFGGITFVEGDRLLLAGQSTASQNGIYIAGAVAAGFAALTRSTDADSSAKVTSGMYTFVSEGTYASNGYVLTTADPIVLNTTGLTFTQFSGAGQITAGDGLTKTGNTINAVAGTGITVNANDIAINNAVVATLSDSQTLTNKVIGSGSSYTGAAIGVASGGTGLTTFPAGGIMYGSVLDTYAALAIGANGKYLASDGSVPYWADAAKAISDCVVGTGGDYATIYDAYAAGKRVMRLRGTITETESINMTQTVCIIGEGWGKSIVNLPNDAAKTFKSTAADSYFGGFCIVGGNVNLTDGYGWLDLSGLRVVAENLMLKGQGSTTTTTGNMISLNGSSSAYSVIRGCVFTNNNAGQALIGFKSSYEDLHISIVDNIIVSLQKMRFVYVRSASNAVSHITISGNRGSITSGAGTAYSGIIYVSVVGYIAHGITVSENNFRIDAGTVKGIYFENTNGAGAPAKNENIISDNLFYGYNGAVAAGIFVYGGTSGMVLSGNSVNYLTAENTEGNFTVSGNVATYMTLSCSGASIIGNYVRYSLTITGLTRCAFSGNTIGYGDTDFSTSSYNTISNNIWVGASGNVTIAGSYNAVTGNYIKGNFTISGTNHKIRGNTYEGTYANTSTLSVTDYLPGSAASAATHTINAGIYDFYAITAQAANFTIAAPTGGLNQGQELILRIKDDGTQRAITWNAVWRGICAALPANTTAGKTSYATFRYNLTDTRWDMIALVTEP